MKKNIFTLTALTLVSALALGACANGQTDNAQQPAEKTATGDLAAAKAAGVLKIGTEGTYVPFTYHDPKTNELTGYDVDVAREVAKRLGLKAEFNEVKWDAIFAGLESNRYDVIANQVTPTAERHAKYGFTKPYAKTVPVVLVAADNNSITDKEAVKGKKSAQAVTSNFGKLATELGANVVAVDGFVESVSALRDGRVELTVNDELAVLDYLKSSNDKTVKVAFELPDGATLQALATRKDSDLVAALDEALEQLRADGTLAKLGEKYFGKDISGK